MCIHKFDADKMFLTNFQVLNLAIFRWLHIVIIGW